MFYLGRPNLNATLKLDPETLHKAELVKRSSVLFYNVSYMFIYPLAKHTKSLIIPGLGDEAGSFANL